MTIGRTNKSKEVKGKGVKEMKINSDKAKKNKLVIINITGRHF